MTNFETSIIKNEDFLKVETLYFNTYCGGVYLAKYNI